MLLRSPPRPSALDTVPQQRGIPKGNRAFDVWDAIGFALVVSLSLLSLGGASLWVSGAEGSPLGWLGMGLGGAGALAAVATALAVGDRRGLRISQSLRSLARPWTDPARDWMLFFLGSVLFIPVAALHSNVIGFHSDSSNLQSSIRYVQRNGIGYLIQSQEVLLPHLILGPALLVAGTSGAMAVSVATVQALAGTVSYLTWKLSRSATAALGAVVSLLAFRSVIRRAALLPMYSTMLIFGLVGVYLAHRAIHSSGRRRWAYAISSGLSLILSIESHQVGQLFLVIPPLLILTGKPRAVVAGLWRVYAAAAVFYLPRAVINLWEGGLSYFILNRVDFWITEGHLVNIQEDFFRYPSMFDFAGYLESFISRMVQIVPSPLGFGVFGLAALGFLLARGQGRWFALAAFALITGVALYREVPPFPRYFSIQIAAAAIGAGLTIGLLGRQSVARRRLASVLLVGLLLAGSVNFAATLGHERGTQRELLSGPLPLLAARIDDDKGVIGSRAMQLPWVDSDVKVFGGFFLQEEELVTYLTWPSDEAVIEVLERHDIGWALVNPEILLETRYNEAWIEPAYGLRIRHVRRLEKSPAFCLAMDREGYKLYRLGDCG